MTQRTWIAETVIGFDFRGLDLDHPVNTRFLKRLEDLPNYQWATEWPLHGTITIRFEAVLEPGVYRALVDLAWESRFMSDVEWIATLGNYQAQILVSQIARIAKEA